MVTTRFPVIDGHFCMTATKEACLLRTGQGAEEGIVASGSGKFDELADRVVDLVGGKDNIEFFTHCVTRLRFNLKDKSLAKTDEIDKIANVIGSKWSGEQLQIIIGQDVDDAYQLICQKHGLKQEESIDENLDEDLVGKKKKFSFNAALDAISGCLVPLIPMLVAGGMLQVVNVLLLQFGIVTEDTPTYKMIGFFANAALYFLPIGVGVTGAKKFGANTAIGIMLGAALIEPGFVEAIANGEALDVYGIPVASVTYSYSVFPMILTMWVCGYVERFFDHHIPTAVRSCFAPLLTVLVMMPIEVCAIGPLGYWFGAGFANVVLWIYSRVGPLAVALLALVFPIEVLTGMHLAWDPYTFNCFATMGYEPLLGVGQTCGNLNQGIASLVVGIKNRDKNVKSTAFSAAITALVGGITEPAIFGITFKYRTPFVAVMIGNFCGALYAGFHNVVRYAYGGGSLLQLAVYIGGENGMENLMNMCIGAVIGMIVTFILTWILYKPESVSEEEAELARETI